MHNAYSIFSHFKEKCDDLVVVYGNVSEITKRDRYRWPQVPNFLVTGEALTGMAGMAHSSLAQETISNWLDSIQWVTDCNINVLDMMHWEHRVGSWAAMALGEYDIAYETLCPYGCREYIELLLQIPFKYRTMPDYKLHKDIIRQLCPGALNYEIITVNNNTNPFVRFAINALYTTYIYDYLKYFYIKVRR